MDFSPCALGHTRTPRTIVLHLKNAQLFENYKMPKYMKSAKCTSALFEEQQLTPYAPRPQRQERERAEWAAGTWLIHLQRKKYTWERSSYTWRGKIVLGNAAHILACKRREALVAQVLCTWVTVETAELYLGK